MKWIEWVPDTEFGVHQQLLNAAGKHSGVIWMVTPPPEMRLSCTPVEMEAVKHYMEEGGLPVGWVDLQGNVHSFVLESPFDPPNFRGFAMGGMLLPYGIHFRKEFLSELYDEICVQNMHKHRGHSA